MRKIMLLLLSLFLLTDLCAAEGISLDELHPKAVGRWPGGVAERESKNRWPDAKFIYPDSVSDMVQLLKQKKIDAFVLQRAFFDSLTAEGIEGIQAADEPLGKRPIGYLFSNSEDGKRLGDEMDTFIEKCRQNGTLEALQQKWLHGDSTSQVFEKPALTGKNGTLTVATNGINMPFVYIQHGKTVGYEVELFALFCAEHGYDYKVEISSSFEGALVGVDTGQYDIGINDVEITEDRQKKFRLSKPTYEDDCLVIVRSEATRQSFFALLAKRLHDTLIVENRWKMLAAGMGTTLLITLSATVFGTLLGFLLCFLHREGNAAVNGAINLISRFFAGMPMMVLLMLFYYVVFGSFNIGGTAVAIVVFSITMGLSVFNMLKSGAASVAKGQTEAALALGFSERQAFRKFVLPQAVLTFFPTYQAELINLLKFTAIVGYIAVQDLTKMADLIRARTYDAFMPLIAISVLYLILAWLFQRTTDWMLTRLDPRRRTADEILRGVKP